MLCCFNAVSLSTSHPLSPLSWVVSRVCCGSRSDCWACVSPCYRSGRSFGLSLQISSTYRASGWVATSVACVRRSNDCGMSDGLGAHIAAILYGYRTRLPLLRPSKLRKCLLLDLLPAGSFFLRSVPFQPRVEAQGGVQSCQGTARCEG